MSRRDWIRTFGDPAVLADLFDAAQSCMATICTDDPEHCDCSDNRMTPLELAQWIQREVHVEGGRPVRFERGHRPRRTARLDRLNLAHAG